MDKLNALKKDRHMAMGKLAYYHQCQRDQRGNFTSMCKYAAYWRDELSQIDKKINTSGGDR